MFGYVTINRGELKVRELETYESYYCGLCRVLKDRYGLAGCTMLNYDMTFLGMLLSSLYEEKEEPAKRVCRPGFKRPLLKEEIKKSAIHAKDSYDYQKLCVKRNGLLSCHYEEDREDLYFYYTVKGMNPFTQVKSESREKKYQILINFSKLKELQADFLLKLTEENLYYDENGLLYLKDRDIYGRGEKPDDTYFLNAYKSFVAGVLGSKYSVKQIQESGIEICKEEKWFEPIL